MTKQRRYTNMSTIDMTKRKIIKDAIIKRLDEHEGCFGGVNVPLLKISYTYPGLWMEHIYDSVFYATVNKDKLYLAENAILSFIARQTSRRIVTITRPML